MLRLRSRSARIVWSPGTDPPAPRSCPLRVFPAVSRASRNRSAHGRLSHRIVPAFRFVISTVSRTRPLSAARYTCAPGSGLVSARAPFRLRAPTFAGAVLARLEQVREDVRAAAAA